MQKRIIFYPVVDDFGEFLSKKQYSDKYISSCKYTANRIVDIYNNDIPQISKSCDDLIFLLKGDKSKHTSIRTQVYRFLEYLNTM